MGSRQPH